MERSEAIGRTFVIDSTYYYRNEILDIGIAVCDGMLKDGSKFRFTEVENGRGLDLGCINQRSRDKVVMNRNDLIKLAEMHLAFEKETK